MDVEAIVDLLRREMQFRIFLPDDSRPESPSNGEQGSKRFLGSVLPGWIAGAVMAASTYRSIDLKLLEKKKVKQDFPRELMKLIHERWSADNSVENLCAQINIDKSYLYKIQKGEKTPTRDVCLRFALALRLNRTETIRLLSLLGYGLSEDVKRDFILLHCIDEHYDPTVTDEVLDELGVECLMSRG